MDKYVCYSETFEWKKGDEIITIVYYEECKKQVAKGMTMPDKFMLIPNDDSQNYPLCRLQSVAETKWTNQSKFNESKKLLRQRIKNILMKLWGLV